MIKKASAVWKGGLQNGTGTISTETGVLKDAPYQSVKIQILPGELIVFYTDGVTEARNKAEEEYGEPRLIDAVSRSSDRPAEAILETILDSVTQFTDGDLESDDLTLVVMKVK